MGHAAPKPITFPDAQGAELLEGYNDLSVRWARRGYVSGGVFDHGTYEEDGPGTWEALASPRPIPVSRSTGDPSPTHDTCAGARVVGPSGAQNKRLHRGRPLDVCFISSLPVMQRPACMAWADKRHVQIVWAVSYTRPDHDVVDDAFD